MEYFVGGYKYIEKNLNDSKQSFEQIVIQQTSGTDEFEQTKTNTLSRNGLNIVLLPIEHQQGLIEYTARKTVLKDPDLAEITDTQFNYFIPPETIFEEVVQRVGEGDFVRCIVEGVYVNPKNAVYYHISDGIAKRVPNYKTLEVMLVQRNKTLFDVKVLESIECNALIKEENPSSDMSGQWKEEFSNLTTFEAFQQLSDSAKEAQDIVKEITDTVTEQIAVANNEAQAAKAQAEADKAQAEADKAEAEQAKQEAEVLKAEYELQLALLQQNED